MKLRHFFTAAIIAVVIVIFILPIVFSISGSGPMLAMPLILTRNGNVVPPTEIKSLQYSFSERPTSFDSVITAEKMKNARPLQIGFLLDAPFSISRQWMFGKESVSPEYKSLLIRLLLVDGTALSVNMPVKSDVSLNSPIQIEVGEKNHPYKEPK